MELDEPDHSDDDMDSSSDQDDSWGAPLAGPPSDVASSSTPPQLPWLGPYVTMRRWWRRLRQWARRSRRRVWDCVGWSRGRRCSPKHLRRRERRCPLQSECYQWRKRRRGAWGFALICDCFRSPWSPCDPGLPYASSWASCQYGSFGRELFCDERHHRKFSSWDSTSFSSIPWFCYSWVAYEILGILLSIVQLLVQGLGLLRREAMLVEGGVLMKIAWVPHAPQELS